jgi:hypothetical protein
MTKTCGRLMPGGRVCKKLMPETGDHAGGCEGEPIVPEQPKPKQLSSSILTNCPCCGYGIHFNCEVGSQYTRSCPVCKTVIKIGIEILEPTHLTDEQLKDKRNQYRG